MVERAGEQDIVGTDFCFQKFNLEGEGQKVGGELQGDGVGPEPREWVRALKEGSGEESLGRGRRDPKGGRRPPLQAARVHGIHKPVCPQQDAPSSYSCLHCALSCSSRTLGCCRGGWCSPVHASSQDTHPPCTSISQWDSSLARTQAPRRSLCLGQWSAPRRCMGWVCLPNSLNE